MFIAFCGLDTSRYKNHSFRIGGACHAADKGYSDAQIRALGRWKSEAFKVYLRSTVCHAKLSAQVVFFFFFFFFFFCCLYFFFIDFTQVTEHTTKKNFTDTY